VILDTSALIAIVLGEPEAQRFAEMIRLSPKRAISAATWVEATIIAGRRSADAASGLETMMGRIAPEIVPLTADQAQLARDGWRRFGKGRHKAALNLGDCFAYALAMERNQPLLFKGDDFAQTDVKRAL
jgi:ribonuclease VapC